MSLPTSQDFPRVETLLFLLNSPPPLVMEAELSKVKAPNWDEIEILVCKKAAYEVRSYCTAVVHVSTEIYIQLRCRDVA